MLATKFSFLIFSMLLMVGCGAYVYFKTFVDGSLTGLNPPLSSFTLLTAVNTGLVMKPL